MPYMLVELLKQFRTDIVNHENRLLAGEAAFYPATITWQEGRLPILKDVSCCMASTLAQAALLSGCLALGHCALQCLSRDTL